MKGRAEMAVLSEAQAIDAIGAQLRRRRRPFPARRMIALVSDSSAQLPALLRERYQVGVVPITIVIDDEQFREGLDLTTAEFYARLEGGAVVSTAAPVTR